MKTTQFIAWTIFILGLLFRISDLSIAGIFMIIGILILSVFSIIDLIRNLKVEKEKTILNSSLTLWAIYIYVKLFFIGFFPNVSGLNTLFLISFGVSVTYIVNIFRNKTALKFHHYMIFLLFLFLTVFSFVHSDRIFYMIKLNEVTQTENRKTNFWDWDNYSWFLYLADKKTEALEANLKSQEIIKKQITEKRNFGLKRDLQFIENHKKLIENSNWSFYEQE